MFVATPGTGARPRLIEGEPKGPTGRNTAERPSDVAPPKPAAAARQFDQEQHEARSHWSETAAHRPGHSMEESTWHQIRTDTNQS